MRHLKLSVTLIALILGGCQALPGSARLADGPSLEPARLPTYAPGEFFEFDNGLRYTVVTRQGESVQWRTNRGAHLDGLGNIFMPPLAWQSGSRRAEAAINGSPTLLWPLQGGNKGRFLVSQTVVTEGESPPLEPTLREWRCAVRGTAGVTVEAGRFDTFVVTCHRYSGSSGNWRGTRTFYYAPAVGYYVLREDRRPGAFASRRELVRHGFRSTLLPREPQRTLSAALLRVLERNPDGVGSAWVTLTARVSARLIPTRSYTSDSGLACRDYESLYRIDGRIHRNERRMCKRAGIWKRVG